MKSRGNSSPRPFHERSDVMPVDHQTKYQADSWTTARRVVVKVERHVGELFPRVGFIVTNLPLPNCAAVRFYNKRGTAEQWIKEEASGALDAPVVSSVPGERGPAATERARVQPREPLVPTRATKTNRQLVTNQPAAAPRQDGWAAGETRSVLLAPAGREPPDSVAVRVDAPADRGAARAYW